MAKLSYCDPDLGIHEGLSDLNTVLISSEEQGYGNYKIVHEIIEKAFKGKFFVFKAIGLPENIIDVMNEIKMYNIYYHKGDSDKFYIKRYPECVAVIDENIIPKILTGCWSNSICERRRIYVLDKENIDTIVKISEQYEYSDDSSLRESWKYVDAFIENLPECKDEAFILGFKSYLKQNISDFC